MSATARKAVGIGFATMLMVILVAFATGCSGQAQAAGKYVAGTYTGEGNGMSGAIVVTLTVGDDDIVSVDEIVDPGETQGIGGKEAIADGTYADQIMEAQSADIDGVSGATITTGGVQQAVQNALDEALRS